MPSTFKVQLGDDIRRLSLSQLSSYAEFCMLIRSLFNISSLNGLQLTYQDEDKDTISIRSEMDMDEARNFASRVPSFKISVQTTDGVSSCSSPIPEPIFPQLAPEDIDLTNSFAELMTDSMQKEKKDSLPAPPAPVSAESSAAPASEVQHQEKEFHKSLDELADKDDSKSPSMLQSVEAKLKQALEALVEFMESLNLNDKVKGIVTDLEPTFAKFEARILKPLEEAGQNASRGIQGELAAFSVQVNEFKQRMEARLQELRAQEKAASTESKPESQSEAPQPVPASAGPVHAAPAPSAPVPEIPHNAMQDLQTLESMGFTDRRKNLELLANFKGDLSAVVDRLLSQ